MLFLDVRGSNNQVTVYKLGPVVPSPVVQTPSNYIILLEDETSHKFRADYQCQRAFFGKNVQAMIRNKLIPLKFFVSFFTRRKHILALINVSKFYIIKLI